MKGLGVDIYCCIHKTSLQCNDSTLTKLPQALAIELSVWFPNVLLSTDSDTCDVDGKHELAGLTVIVTSKPIHIGLCVDLLFNG